MARKQNKTVNDPYYQRELKKYETPIASREYILQYLDQVGKPVSWKHLLRALCIKKEQETTALRYRLKAMIRDGQLHEDRRGRYCLLDKIDLLLGTVQGHPEGFGYVIPDDGSDDMFITPKQMQGVMHGDRVLVRKTSSDKRGRYRGVIHEVVERKSRQLVGRFFTEQGVSWVEPDNQRINQSIVIPADKTAGAVHGQIVMIKITVYPSVRAQALGEVVEILGDHMAPGMEIDIALRSYDLPHIWPAAVDEEVVGLTEQVLEKDKLDRTDLRDIPLVTIDGEDAKDFDDAVYCEPKPNGSWRLLVAIADVSHYVLPESALDKEAYVRGNSVYFPGRVLPMLPHQLSNGLCSLKGHVDRLCMVCDMTISAQGKLMRYRFYRAVMCSHARLTYTQVAAMLVDHDETLQAQYRQLFPHLQHLYRLYGVLAKARKARGAIEFDSTETKILFDQDKKIQQIKPLVRNDAHRLIEECMLMANLASARFLKRHKMPMLYRVHDKPSDDKLADLREFLAELGLPLKGGKKPQPADFAHLIEKIQGRPDAHMIQTVLLRSLKAAVYTPENIGHFGLAFKEYTHFTSPIRRYPDLLVHRAIAHLIDHQAVEDFAYDVAAMQRFGQHCSDTERRADQATWDVIAWLKCEYMQDKLGEEFDGVISSVTGFGVFVELSDVYVEGLVHISSLPSDYYHFDMAKHRLIGERHHRVFRLGDKLRVQVVRVDLDDRKMDFEWVKQ